MIKRMIFIGVYLVSMISVYAQSYIMIVPNKYPKISKQKKTITKIVTSLDHNRSLKVTLKSFQRNRFIQVGPLYEEKQIRDLYMVLKKKFPYTMLLGVSDILTPKSKPVEVKIVEKKVVVTQKVEVPVKKEDTILWIALFGLATIGVLYIFLSSDKIRRLKESQESVKKKHKKFEEKQHEVLESMGENIHTIATVTQQQTTKLAEKVKESALHHDVSAVMQNENTLLDITEDLIKFLQLKSKKIVVQNEIFNFNNVLNEVIGTLNEASKKHHVELILDIDKEVPYRISADSSHLGKILINLLDYYIQHTLESYVRLIITTQTTLSGERNLIFEIVGHVEIENKESFFETSYDDEDKQYIGLGLFVAKELIDLMNGKLTILTENNIDTLHMTIPIEEPNKDKRMYRLTRKDTMKKRVMIADPSYYAAAALKKRFEYFRIETTLIEAINIKHVLQHINNINIVVLDRRLLTPEIVEILKKKKEEYPLKVIALENLFEKYDHNLPTLVDTIITKPFSPSYVFETLEFLYIEKQNVVSNVKEKRGDVALSDALLIHKKPFEGKENILLSDFGHFSGTTLLLVEDNRINQKVVLNVLSQSGITILIANNGQEAVELVREHGMQINFILMDINMPILDGFNASKIIREERQFDAIPIVSLTALVAEHEIEKMFEAGMNGYLAKPLKVDKLYTALETFIKPKEHKIVQKRISGDNTRVFDGFYPQRGLAYMKGNKIFYQEVLREFIDAYATSHILFETLVKKKEYDSLMPLLLDVRGISRAIGAQEMYILVSEIQQLVKEKEYRAIESYIIKYEDTLLHLIQVIQSFLDT